MMSSHEGLYREYISYPIYSLSRAAQTVTVSSKDAAKIHFFRKVCEKKVRFFEKNFHRFITI